MPFLSPGPTPGTQPIALSEESWERRAVNGERSIG
jgi:hypothetical protein